MSMPARKNRTTRRAWMPYSLGVVAAVALLTTTACEPGTTDAAGSSNSPSATSSAGSAGSATSGATASADTGDGGAEQSEDSSEAPLCAIEDLKVSATNQPGESEDARYILLTVTNAGKGKCDVQGAPVVTLGDAQGPAPAKEETDSGEPVTLAAGGKAYAGLLATGGHRDTYDVTFMKLGLGSPGGESEAGPEVDVPMPVDSFPADDGQWVSYWQGTEGLAMRPVTQS